MRRLKISGNRQAADVRVMEDSDYFIPKAFVEQFAKAGPLPKGPAIGAPLVDSTSPDTVPDNLDVVADTVTALEGDPTDDVDVNSPEGEGLESCVKNWKAASADEKKRSWDIFDETGIFAGACRHGFILWVIDMVRSGEL